MILIIICPNIIIIIIKLFQKVTKMSREIEGVSYSKNFNKSLSKVFLTPTTSWILLRLNPFAS